MPMPNEVSMSMSKSKEEIPMSMSMSMSKSKKLTKKYVRELIEECGRMYNFDGKEALIKLNLEKEKVKKEKKKSFLLPFDGKKMEGCCNGIVKNNGLYTQCSKKVDGYCKKCEKQSYGNIDERVKVGLYEYKDPKGKSPKRYLDVLKKKKISKEEVDEYCRKESIIIAEQHLEESSEKVKRGRPAKTENKVKVSTGKKGRPKKEKKELEVTSSTGEDDLFASLVAQANASSSAVEEVKVVEEVKIVEEVKVKAKVEKPKKVKVANGNAKKGRPKKEKKEVELSSSSNEEAPVVVAVVAPVVVQAEEEADVVKKIEYEGKKYYKSKKSGIIYNMEQDVVGKWNEESGKIDFEEEEEEEEDEYDE